MNWRRFARIIHRDLGYLIVGTTIVYAISGLAMNHARDWNPDYAVIKRIERVDASALPEKPKREEAKAFLQSIGIDARFKTAYPESQSTIKLFYEGGSAIIDRSSGEVQIEELRRRPVLHLFNRLHRNPGRWWTWFSDIFCIGLLIVSISGIILLPGKNGITRRGGILTAAGILLPTLLVIINL